MTATATFQSQNGLILTVRKHEPVKAEWLFQSQNGLILTIIFWYLQVLLSYISIPKWSDFNFIEDEFVKLTFKFQSQNGLILTR